MILKDEAVTEGYVIKELVTYDIEPLYWSNDTGWGDFESATVFDADEYVRYVALPLDGAWERVYMVNLPDKEVQ